ncbi:MAG: hypothetical protein JWQ04_2617, partial [Pedosphaera sp.]|nr:hypothetical protein [Pedosphaera sp.]
VSNVISCSNQTVPLPPGNYATLRMLASGVQGNQVSQSFLVTYADSTTANFVQSLSDWFSPQNYSGESKAVIMGHRNSANGTLDNRTFYLYGYSFNLNSSKAVQSIRLPNNGNVIVTSITFVPNLPPTFSLVPFTELAANAGQAYSGTIATNATDVNGDPLTFAKVSGPAWLNVFGSGALSGTPLSGDVGGNSFVVSVSDPGGLSNTSTMSMNVIAAPPITASISLQNTNLLLSWTGGIAPYQVQTNADLTPTNWGVFAGPLSATNLVVTPTNSAAFYRIIGN